MMQIPVLYVKDKQAFVKVEGTFRLAGKPIDIAKDLHKKGIELVHFIDLDAEKGNPTNFDIYDNLTYLMHIQVEGPKDERLVKKLLAMNVRVVVKLPTQIDLAAFAEKKRLLVGKVEVATAINDSVFDLLYMGNEKPVISALFKTEKRIILANVDVCPKGKKPFGILCDLGELDA
jgi:phosphoribosylformimino-5-aminoimidazole carboxamide ribonucleotide (ProFAR) isomerase